MHRFACLEAVGGLWGHKSGPQGDSGGPVFVGVSGQPSQLAAIGVTVGAGGALVRACGPRMEHYFMAIQDVESALGVSLATTP